MKPHFLVVMIFVIAILVTNIQPVPILSARAQGGEIQPYPQTGKPSPDRPYIQLDSTSKSVLEPLAQGTFPNEPIIEMINPGTIAGEFIVPNQETTGNIPALGQLESIDKLQAPDQAQGCYNYLLNGDFESNGYWSATANVWYSYNYHYQGNRSLYLSTYEPATKLWYNPAVWQLVQIPAQVSSMFVRFRTTANIDAGDGAWVTIYDKTFANLLWYGVIPYTQTGWTEYVFWLPQNTLAGKEINITFQLQYDSDFYYSDLYVDVAELGICDSGTQPPPQNTSSRVIPLTVSIPKVATQTERDAYQEIMGYFADAIYEMSNGKHQIGTVTFLQNWSVSSWTNWKTAHVLWYPNSWPRAAMNGYWIAAYDASQKITYSDIYDGANLLLPANWQAGGYGLAHEFGHSFYGLADEYQATDKSPCDISYFWCPRNDDYAVTNSVMNNQWNAVDNRGGDLKYLNFSVAKYNTKRNAQDRTHGASGWETLVRPPSQDRKLPLEAAKIPRTYYQELVSAAPQGTNDPSHQLPGERSQARAKLGAIVWVSPTNGPEAVSDYQASVISVAGDAVAYPQTALIIASISKLGTIAKANVQAQVTAPGGVVAPVTLLDNGVAPDEIANDGRYSGYMPYNQNGVHTVDVTFGNTSGLAVYTMIGLADAPWVLGDSVGENFSASASSSITISNFAADDHSDLQSGATLIYTDNQSWPARVDRAGDIDIFKGELLGNGTFIFRMASFADGMQPRIRFLAEDGTTLLGEFIFTPQAGYYYIFNIVGDAGDKFYAEITHANTQATRGSYEISFGRALNGELPNLTFLPITFK